MSYSAQKTNLGKMAQISAGYALRTSVETLGTGGVGMIQLKNARPGHGIAWNDIAKVAIGNRRAQNWLSDGDVLFAARNASNFAVALEDVPPQTLCAPHFFVIRIRDGNKLNPDFLAWQMNQLPAQGYFRKAAVGTSVMNIRREDLEDLPILIPPYPTQKSIVNIWKTALAETCILQKLIVNQQQQMDALAATLCAQGGK